MKYVVTGKHPSGKGWILNIKKEDKTLHCHHCRKELETPFYYCREKDVLFCRQCCIYEHNRDYVTEHIDWHIIEIEEKK